MPHDLDGHLLSVSDIVIVRCKITHIQQGEEYCNITLETNIAMYPSDNKTTFNLNAKQVEKIG